MLKNLIPKICPSIAGLIIFKDFRFLKISELTPFPCLLPLESVDATVERAVGQMVVDCSLAEKVIIIIVYRHLSYYLSVFIYIQIFTENYRKNID